MMDILLHDNRLIRLASIGPASGECLFQLFDAATGTALTSLHACAQLHEWEPCDRVQLDEDGVTCVTVDPETGEETTTLLDHEDLAAALELALAPDVTALRQSLLACLALRRWQAETGGFIFADTFEIKSDAASALRISEAAAQAKADPAWTVRWKVGDVTWVDLDAAAILAVRDALRGHVRACFAREEALCGEILAAETAAELEVLRPDIDAFAL